jgi:hypothetical protein
MLFLGFFGKEGAKAKAISATGTKHSHQKGKE